MCNSNGSTSNFFSLMVELILPLVPFVMKSLTPLSTCFLSVTCRLPLLIFGLLVVISLGILGLGKITSYGLCRSSRAKTFITA